MWKRLIAVFPFIKRKSSQKASKHKQLQGELIGFYLSTKHATSHFKHVEFKS